MTYVWTKQAEQDYREKWGPDRPCKRVAGQVVMYCGSTVVQTSILKAYAERGWVKQAEETPKADDLRGLRSRVPSAKEEAAQKARWQMMQKEFGRRGVKSLKDVAVRMGLYDYNILTIFVKAHGKELAAKYGKLPYFKRSQKWNDMWLSVMEAKA
jgi:hypothetical protein